MKVGRFLLDLYKQDKISKEDLKDYLLNIGGVVTRELGPLRDYLSPTVYRSLSSSYAPEEIDFVLDNIPLVVLDYVSLKEPPYLGRFDDKQLVVYLVRVPLDFDMPLTDYIALDAIQSLLVHEVDHALKFFEMSLEKDLEEAWEERPEELAAIMEQMKHMELAVQEGLEEQNPEMVNSFRQWLEERGLEDNPTSRQEFIEDKAQSFFQDLYEGIVDPEVLQSLWEMRHFYYVAHRG